MRKAFVVTMGCLLAMLSIAGGVHAINASRAYVAYHTAKFGACKDSPSDIFLLAEKAQRLYDSNYYLCILAAETAFRTYTGLEAPARGRRLATAAFWCERGLQSNPYNSQLRLLNARLVALDSPARAADLWAEYVDWNFWVPFNHAMLVEFLANAGQFGPAIEALKWVEGTPYHADARRALEDAWRREMSVVPPAAGSGQ